MCATLAPHTPEVPQGRGQLGLAGHVPRQPRLAAKQRERRERHHCRERHGHWLRQSSVPKLFLNGEPGAILTESRRDFCRTWPAQREVTVRGLHFLQEDSPDEIGRAIADWLPAIREGHAA